MMKEEKCMEMFLHDLDHIALGKDVERAHYAQCDPEYIELLDLAKLLAEADFAERANLAAARLKDKLFSREDLDDEELDLVAGGRNTNPLNLENDDKFGFKKKF